MGRKKSSRSSQPDCAKCEHCRLPEQGLFSGISKEEFSQLGISKRCRLYRKREIVFREGEPAKTLFCVISGWVKLWKATPNGHLQIVRWAGPGDPLGYRSITAGENYRATAQTVTKAVICHLSNHDLQALILNHPTIANNILSRLTKDLGSAEERLLQVSYLPVKQRLAQLLLRLNGHSPDGFHLTRLDMAQIIGTSPETLIRLLTELHEQGILRRSRRGFKVLDEEYLREMAGINDL